MISVVVTAYKQEKTISQTIKNILNQHCEMPVEIVIGDDGSDDRTEKIVNKIRNNRRVNIRLIRHSENIGVAANFAQCIKESKGKYIALCAADDYWHNPNKLQLQVDYLESNPDVGLIYTDYHKLNVNTGRITENHLTSSGVKIYQGENLTSAIFSGKVPILTVTVMFRKELFDRYVPADDYIKYKFPLEDWPTWLILSKYTKFAYLPVSTATYRYGHDSISNPTTYEKITARFEKEKFMYKYICDMFPDTLHYDANGYDLYVLGILLNLAYKKKDYSSAKKFASELKILGANTWKVRATENRLAFYVFSTLKQLKAKL
jgi:glycosyltransferase involved in cell wall biosynthesis